MSWYPKYPKKNNYRESSEDKQERKYWGTTCPVCGRPLSKERPVCFACPIHSVEYYERKRKENNENQI
jgi:uncharacterized OB-fold protein